MTRGEGKKELHRSFLIECSSATHPSTHLSTHLSSPPTYLFTHLPIHLPSQPATDLSIHLPIYPSLCPTIQAPLTSLHIHPSTILSSHLPTPLMAKATILSSSFLHPFCSLFLKAWDLCCDKTWKFLGAEPLFPWTFTKPAAYLCLRLSNN